MKIKTGYTLAEVLVTLAVIGLLAVISIPILHNVIPVKEEYLFQKSYYQIENIVSDLVNNDTLYGKNETYPTNSFSNLKAIQNSDMNIEAGSNTKFCQLFANQLKIKRGVACDNQINNFTENQIAHETFVTDDDMQWILPVSYFVEPNTPKKIFIDVNGEKGQNCYIQNRITCKHPDRFSILVYPNGKVERDYNPLENIPDDIVPDDNTHSADDEIVFPKDDDNNSQEEIPKTLKDDFDIRDDIYKYEVDKYSKRIQWDNTTIDMSYSRHEDSQDHSCDFLLKKALRELANTLLFNCQNIEDSSTCTYQPRAQKLKDMIDKKLYPILQEYAKNKNNPSFPDLVNKFDNMFKEDLFEVSTRTNFLYGRDTSYLVDKSKTEQERCYVNRKGLTIREQTVEPDNYEPFDTGDHGGRAYFNPLVDLFVEVHIKHINEELRKLQ